jgi:hypothetical protein
MVTYHIYGPSKGRWTVNLTPPIAQGAAGTIHRVVGEPGIVVKLYKDPKDLPAYNQKIESMLAARPNLPPFSYNGRTYVQIAWPLGKVCNGRGDFLGFVMPEVDIQASTELENVLQKAMRTRKGISEFYGTRVLLAANLAALMAELHALGHHMIDMKPINMRFYPHAWYMAILDTDGFSINGQCRLPGHQYSDEYIAPEARGKSPESLGLEQDLFALATIIFRLINNGLHPYQGIDLGNHPTTLQERIFAGLYAYGVRGHPAVRPAPSSIHQYLEDETRALFDRAFQISGSRPTSAEWRDHLNGLITNKVLVRCAADSKNHAHFSKGCGLCALSPSGSRASARQQPVQAPATVLNTLPTAPIGAAPVVLGQANYGSSQTATYRRNLPRTSAFLVLACVVAIGFYTMWPRHQETGSNQMAVASASRLPGLKQVAAVDLPVPTQSQDTGAKAMTPQLQKMKDCAVKWKEEKAEKHLSGKDAYRDFMADCLTSASLPLGWEQSYEDAVRSAVESTFRNNPDHVKLQETVIVGEYALQTWVGDNTGGQALVKLDVPSNQWKIVNAGGGAWSADALIKVMGVPADVAAALMGQLQQIDKSPSHLVTSFYRWYLHRYMSDLHFKSSPGFGSSLATRLSPDFISNWQKILNTHDVDPVLLSQDYGNTWISNIKTSVAYESTTKGTVLVSLGTGSDIHNLRVHLVFMNNRWLISSVTPGEATPDRYEHVSYDGSHTAVLRLPYDDWSVVIDSTTNPKENGRAAVATIYNGKSPSFSFHMNFDLIGTAAAEVRAVRLDWTAKLPQVVLTSYSGGAHCCIFTKIATLDSAGTWHEVDGGALDGDSGYQFIDLNYDGSAELISFDNSFLYAFGCYACSTAPIKIKKLIGTELKNVTNESRYQSYLRERLWQMEASARMTNPNAAHSNGYLGGWVAAKALIGELNDAWRSMLATYDRQSDWIMEECLTEEPLQKCPQDRKRKLEFPEALAKHLFRNGYVTAEQERQLILARWKEKQTKPTSPTEAANTFANAQPEDAVRAAFERWISANNFDNVKPRKTVIARDYSLQHWRGDNTSGQTLFKYTHGEWIVLLNTVGELTADELEKAKVPADVTPRLIGTVQRNAVAPYDPPRIPNAPQVGCSSPNGLPMIPPVAGPGQAPCPGYPVVPR